MKRSVYEKQVALALKMYEKAGIVLSDAEKRASRSPILGLVT